MTNTIEYLSSGLVLILIFSTTATSLVWVLDPVYRTVSRREVQSAAESLLTHVLGYSGYPVQWGSDLTVNASTLQGLGLAKASKDDTSLNVDMDKITRLADRSAGTYICTDVVGRLTNLKYHYGFNLKFIPALNISIKPTKTMTTHQDNKVFELAYNLTVMTHEQIKVANVNLTGYILLSNLINNQSGHFVEYSIIGAKKTCSNWRGEASFDFTDEMLPCINKTLVGEVLMVTGFYYGMRTMSIRQAKTCQDMLSSTVIGDNIILSVQPEEIPNGASHLQRRVVEGTIDCVAESGFVDVTDNVHAEAPWVINYGSKDYRVYKVAYMEPDIYFIGFVVKYLGKYWLVIGLRVPQGDIGDPIPNAAEVAEVRRLVLIDGFSYYAVLHLWKVSWS